MAGTSFRKERLPHTPERRAVTAGNIQTVRLYTCYSQKQRGNGEKQVIF